MRLTLRASALLASALMSASADSQDFTPQRRQMIDEIVRTARSAALETGRGTISPAVLAALERVPRHRFVPPKQQPFAYENRPLDIGDGQTISQPYIVAFMTDLIAPQRGHRVLEVGTGSGYQAAVLAELAGSVFSIEIVEKLGREAARVLSELGYKNVSTRIGDGYQGWPEEAPFDSILVTAAAPEVPGPLVAQLKPGGRLVIPVGSRAGDQHIVVIDKAADGKTTSRKVLPVRFVPLTRGKAR